MDRENGLKDPSKGTSDIYKPREVFADTKETLIQARHVRTRKTLHPVYISLYSLPTDVWTVQSWIPGRAESCKWYWCLEPIQEKTSLLSCTASLRTSWTSKETKLCCTTFTNEEDGKSEYQQRAIGSFDEKPTQLGNPFLRYYPLRSVARLTEQKRTRGVHREHRSWRITGSSLD